MNRYTKEEALLLAQRLDDSGQRATDKDKYVEYVSRLEGTLLGCHLYPLWFNLIKQNKSETALWSSPIRWFMYDWIRDCYRPLREVPLRLAQHGVTATTINATILKWRLEIGK